MLIIPMDPNNALGRAFTLLSSRRPSLPNSPISLQWKLAHKNAMNPPTTPRRSPSKILEGSQCRIVGASCNAQICSSSRPARLRNTTTQISPAKIASIECSKYSIPNLLATSSANRDPPRGTPKNADNEPAMPMKVCFLTTLVLRWLKTLWDITPAKAAQIATSGASGPREPPATMLKRLDTTMGIM